MQFHSLIAVARATGNAGTDRRHFDVFFRSPRAEPPSFCGRCTLCIFIRPTGFMRIDIATAHRVARIEQYTSNITITLPIKTDIPGAIILTMRNFVSFSFFLRYSTRCIFECNAEKRALFSRTTRSDGNLFRPEFVGSMAVLAFHRDLH